MDEVALMPDKGLSDVGADGAPVKLGIFGGTFDPLHLGHLRIAEEVREALGLAGVLFVPAGVPVFKKGQPVTSADKRLAAALRAVADNPHFAVCPWEVRREGDTYTVDTLRALRKHYPDNVELYFIVGSDAAELLGQWKGADELAQLAHFAVAVGRPGSLDEEGLCCRLRQVAPFKLHFVPVSQLEISSSGIRQLQDRGKSVRYLVPASQWESVTAPPWKTAGGPKGEDAQERVLSKDFLEARRRELRDRVGPKRFEHSLNVAKTAQMLAKTYGVDPKKARLAGLLHDWDKGMDDDQARKRVRELGMEEALDPWVVQEMPQVLHGRTAAWALARDFPEIPADVLQAIDRHTVAHCAMEPLDMVVYIADAIEPGRQFGSVDQLRDAVGKVDLEELFFRTYEYWTYLLLECRRPLHPDTISIWNCYASRLGHKKGKRKK